MKVKATATTTSYKGLGDYGFWGAEGGGGDLMDGFAQMSPLGESLMCPSGRKSYKTCQHGYPRKQKTSEPAKEGSKRNSAVTQKRKGVRVLPMGFKKGEGLKSGTF